MFSLGLFLFSTYAILQAFDELRFHRTRDLSKKERLWRSLNTFLIMACLGYTLFLKNSDSTNRIFNFLLLTSFCCFSLSEWDRKTTVDGPERWLHSVLAMLHPLILGMLNMVRRFIDGTGFFLGLVLPFTAHNLRPLCMGYLVATTILLAIQWIPKKKLPVAETTQIPTEAPNTADKMAS